MAQKNKQDKTKIKLETEAPEKTDQGFQVLVTATLTRGDQALEEEMVQFFLNSVEIGQPGQTDQNGRAQYNITGVSLDTKSISVEAQLVGQTAQARKTVLLLSGKKPREKPYDLEIKTETKEGKYFLNATIVDADGIGVKGTVRMLSDEGKQDFPTKDDGVVFFELEIDERQKQFDFLVLGTRIDKTLRLSGKKQTKPQRPEPTNEEIRGFWKSLKSGWRKRKEA